MSRIIPPYDLEIQRLAKFRGSLKKYGKKKMSTSVKKEPEKQEVSRYFLRISPSENLVLSV